MNKKTIEELTSTELYSLWQAKIAEEWKKSGLVRILCGHCGKTSILETWSRIITHNFDNCPYSPNHIATDDIELICPKCNYLNRFLCDTEYDYKQKKSIRKNKSTLFTKLEKYIGCHNKFSQTYKEYDEGGVTNYYLNDKKCEVPFTGRILMR